MRPGVEPPEDRECSSIFDEELNRCKSNERPLCG